ncbi:OmpP1/FadL family transporter [Halothiobacillus sp.]|uniref:OmpP1/FadL family transporter n=1 Tax=Halothiobacillus sp. TaxID=1891311 RepID=UPI00262833B6|nr:outer membrane protein transport protein [Halothiobacillus sp.]MDD4967160.1 outer membrane protein transport protein [Halothiobacillus sp.]MDY0146755.1 outer membrane protein transport protein [Halothiobacillus sp.]
MVFKRSLLAASVAATLIASGAAHATNGYFSHGYGVKSMGMGGSGVALPNDSAMIIATNPAGITETGTQVNFDISWFHPVRGYSQTSNSGMFDASAESNSNNFYIPELSASYAINDTSSIGIAIYGNGGMNSDYSSTATSLFGAGNTGPFASRNPSTGALMGGGEGGVNLQQMFIAPTYAHKFMDGKLSVGASILFARQTIKVKGLGAFDNAMYSTDPGYVTGNEVSHSTGWGGKIGVLFHATDMISLAASYQTKMAMSKFDEYKGLFAEGGKFDIPSTWTVGGAFHVAPAWTLTADFQRINYSGVKSIANTSTTLGTNQLGADNGPGFGWKDVNVVKLGAQWQMTPALQLRVGFNHGTNPISSQDVVFNTLAPGVVKNHYTAGLTYAIDQHQEVSGAFMYAPDVTVTGPNNAVAAYDPSTTTTIHMKQYEATIGYAYKF